MKQASRLIKTRPADPVGGELQINQPPRLTHRKGPRPRSRGDWLPGIGLTSFGASCSEPWTPRRNAALDSACWLRPARFPGHTLFPHKCRYGTYLCKGSSRAGPTTNNAPQPIISATGHDPATNAPELQTCTRSTDKLLPILLFLE